MDNQRLTWSNEDLHAKMTAQSIGLRIWPSWLLMESDTFTILNKGLRRRYAISRSAQETATIKEQWKQTKEALEMMHGIHNDLPWSAKNVWDNELSKVESLVEDGLLSFEIIRINELAQFCHHWNCEEKAQWIIKSGSVHILFSCDSHLVENLDDLVKYSEKIYSGIWIVNHSCLMEEEIQAWMDREHGPPKLESHSKKNNK